MVTSFDWWFFQTVQTNNPENRKTAYRWLGWKAIAGPEGSLGQNSSKRVFGAEITNYSLKRNNSDSLMDPRFQKKKKPMYHKPVDLENQYDDTIWEHPPRNRSKAVDFGPFAPNKFIREDPEQRNETGSRLEDKELWIISWKQVISKYYPVSLKDPPFCFA